MSLDIDPDLPLSRHFTYGEVLWLPLWNRLSDEKDGLNEEIIQRLKKFYLIMDQIRDFLDRPMFVLSGYRPPAYNQKIRGSKKSAHQCLGDWAALDFWCDLNGNGQNEGTDCLGLKKILLPELARFGLRMEDNGDRAKWVHLDSKPALGGRFFKP